MMRQRFTSLALALLIVATFTACTSSQTNEIADQDILAEAEMGMEGPANTGSPPAADEFADDFAEEFGADDLAFEEDFSGELTTETAPPPAEAATPAAEAAPEVIAEDPFATGGEDFFAEEPLAETTPAAEPTPTFFEDEPAATSSAAPPVIVESIDFIANEAGGTLQVKTSNTAAYQGRYNAQTNQYILEIQNAELDPKVKRPYIMKEFQTAFGVVNSYKNDGGNTARIVVQMKEPVEPVVQQEGDRIILVAPGMGLAGPIQPTAAPAPPQDDSQSYDTDLAAKEEKILGARTLEEFLSGTSRFYGRPISIQVNDANIQDVINFIADESGANIVLSDDVAGKISLKLRQIPWDQALVIVMRSKGLGYIRQGNVIRISKLDTLQAETKAAQEIVTAQNRLTPLKVKVIPVSYATVADLEKQVAPFLTLERGKVVSDPRTSSLIITDTPEVLSRVERLVQELDIPPAQVMIEGKIVEASETFSRTLGVNWGFSGVPLEVSSGGGFQGNPIQVSPSFNSNSIAPDRIGGLNSTFNVTIGTLDFFGNLDARLGLAQTDSLVKVVSSPRVVTMNRAEAEISQKGEVLTSSSTVNNGVTTSTVERSPVELKLIVTPQITAEGSVILDVNVTRQFAGGVIEGLSRPINTRAAKTRVLVPNGQTAVIGGIYASEETSSESGVPGLKNVPVLGWLFKSKTEDKLKNELLIFLTPRILNAKEQGVSGS